MLILKLRDGGERIYIYNSCDSAYVTAVVDSEHGITDAAVASAYPVLPVKFITEEDKSGMFDYSRAAADKKRFQVRLAPDGVTVVDIRRETNL